MKKRLIAFLLLALLPMLCFSQGKKKLKGKSISASTSINYYPAIEPYSYFSSFSTKDQDIILTYLTANSGTFVVEDEGTLFVERSNENNFPSQLLSLGASVQFKKGNTLFHEISLTKFSLLKSSHEIEIIHRNSSGGVYEYRSGFTQRAAAFGFRYEYGKYFWKRKNSKLRFGLSGGIEPSIYFYKRTSRSPSQYPMKGKIFTTDIALIPMLSATLSKKVSMEFKIIPNMLVADFGKIKELNPTFAPTQGGGEREYNLPEISLAFSLQLKYIIKEKKR